MFNPEDAIMIGQFLDDDGRLKATTLDYNGLSNGILIGGISNTGKTNTIESILYQLIVQYGARLLVADYQGGVKKSITPRLESLVDSAILQPIAIEGNEIEALIEQFAAIVEQRKTGAIPEIDHYPLVLVIDEFITFADDYSPPDIKEVKRQGDLRITQQKPNYFTKMKTILNNCRRVNASVIIAGQTFITTKGVEGISVIRNIFNNKIIHKMTPNDLKTFNYDAKTMRVINGLNPGYAWYGDRVIKIPLVMPTLREAALAIASQYETVNTTPAIIQEDTFLADMLDKYGKRTIKIESREDIIRLLKYDAGLSYNQIREFRLPGNNEELHKLYNSV